MRGAPDLKGNLGRRHDLGTGLEARRPAGACWKLSASAVSIEAI